MNDANAARITEGDGNAAVVFDKSAVSRLHGEAALTLAVDNGAYPAFRPGIENDMVARDGRGFRHGSGR